MILVYYGLICLIHILTLPFLLLFACKQKYRRSIPSRFFFPKDHSKERYDIWLHACSVGEVQSLQALIEEIPTTQTLFLTVITQTGFERAHKLYGQRENLAIDYLPFESLIPFFMPTCKKLFVFEAELWLMLFVHAKKNGAYTKLINARISTRSFGRYMRLAFFYKHLFSFIDVVLSQSDDDTLRLQSLGAKNVETLGNIKVTNKITPTKLYPKPKRLVVVAASTHEGEEKFILNAFKQVQEYWKSGAGEEGDFKISSDRTDDFNSPNTKDSKNALFVIAPRHPERFSTVYTLCADLFTPLRFSELQEKGMTQDMNLDNFSSELLLLDTIGELINFYAISDIVVLGGSFVKIGGHNPLEIATFHNILLSGTEIFNQKALFGLLQNYYLINEHELFEYLKNYETLQPACINYASSRKVLEKIFL